MKANAPEKIYIHVRANKELGTTWHSKKITNNDIEYIRKDAFIEKARKWFEKQPELYDANGVRVYGEEDFEDFRKYIGE